VVGDHLSSYAVDVEESLGGWRDVIDPTPDHEKDLGTDVVGLV
jgi:hypothetical protein